MFGTVWSAALAVAVSAQSGAQTPGQRGRTGNNQNERQMTVTGCLQSGDASGTGPASTSGSSSPSATSGTSRADFILTNVSVSGSTMSGGSSGADSRPVGRAKSTAGAGTAGTANPTGSGSTAGVGSGSGAGSTATGSTTASAQGAYRLTGNIGEMNKLVNRRVEVTGTLDTKEGAGASGVGTVPNASTGAQTGSGTTRTGAPDTASSRTGSDSTRMAGDRVGGTAQAPASEMPSLRVTSIREVSGGANCSTGR